MCIRDRVNRAFSANLGVPAEKTEGRLLREAGDGRWNIPDLLERLHEVQTSGEPLDDWEVTLNLRQQGRRVMSLSARQIPGDAAREQHLLLAIEDITVRADRTAGLLASGELKDRFIAMLGHELRHPLTPITHAIYLLRQGNKDPDALDLLETIDTQTQTLLRFVNELLDLARIGQGLIEIHPVRLDVVALVRETVQTLRPLVGGRRQSLTLELPPAPLYINGDRERLGQVVTNLVENAAKYTGMGGRIAVTIEQRGEHAMLRVSDSGIGIAAADLERIFEPFTRAHPPLVSPQSGLGIGLTVVRQILQLHGGQIKVSSGGPGCGSEFSVSLPLVPAGAIPSPVRPAEDAGAGRTQRVRRVMVVDDHEEVRTSIARLARSWGHEVAMASDGPKALSLAETFQPECAVVDLSLPGMNGIEIAKRLRHRFPAGQLFLIALTGYADANIRDACFAAGFDAHLVKPGEIEQLENLLADARNQVSVK